MLTFARALPTARLTAEAAWQLRVCSLVHLKASAYLADIGSRAGLPQVDLWERALFGGQLQGLGNSPCVSRNYLIQVLLPAPPMQPPMRRGCLTCHKACADAGHARTIPSVSPFVEVQCCVCCL